MEQGYELLDSGHLKKLERFGDKILIRPSRFSIWAPRNETLWQTASAEYEPKKGWKFTYESFQSWTIDISLPNTDSISLELRLQNNGQIGFFPEHLQYAARLQDILTQEKDTPARPKVLNLFAYTGLATVVCARAGAEVIHLDLSKQANQWAQQNFTHNHLDSSFIKIIQDDAVKFTARLASRGENFDLIIADPPSFSRVSEKKTWDLEEVLHPLLLSLKEVLSPNGALLLTSHQYEYGETVMANLEFDTFGDHSQIDSSPLFLNESHSPRRLPAGYASFLKRSKD